jgi:hypothetical protein
VQRISSCYTYTPPRPTVNPLLLLARRAIEEAFEAARKFQDGEPTEDAVDALRWIEDRLDWTRLRRSDGTVPIPPRHLHVDFVLSFDWCCRLLELDPAKIRENGLPRSPRYIEHSTQGGLPRIYRMWAEERAASERGNDQLSLAKQESEPSFTSVPVTSTFAPEALGASGLN